MAGFDLHLVKPLVEFFRHRWIYCFLIICEDINPGLKDNVRKQCQTSYVVNLTDKALSIPWVIHVYIGHDSNILQDPY
jgi:hypothetical protein